MDDGEGQQHNCDFLDFEQLLKFGTLGYDQMDGMSSVEPNYTNIDGVDAAAPGQNNNGMINQTRECPFPDEILQLNLSMSLGMTQMQVKAWFQNRRAALKNKMMQRESEFLREEKEMLEDQKRKINAVIHGKDKRCLRCRGWGPKAYNGDTPEKRRLLAENAKLKEELLQAFSLLNVVSGGRARAGTPIPKPFSPYGGQLKSQCATSGGDSGSSPTMLLDHVLSRASEEFMSLAVSTLGEPMWLLTVDGEVLNKQTYNVMFRPDQMGFAMDGTRKTAMVMVKADNLVRILMDPAHWSKMFPGIVASVTSSQIVNPNASPHELIQLMNAELRVLVPRVPLVKVKFARQCLQVQPNVWAVVDVSVDGIPVDISESNGDSFPTTYTACRMLPSGCLIEELKDGYCKITWMVHAGYDMSKIPQLHLSLLDTGGQALGACRWLNSLKRQCEYLAFLHSDPHPLTNPVAAMLPEVRKSVLESSQQMKMNFYKAMCDSAGRSWSTVDEWAGDCGVGAEKLHLAVRFVTSLAAIYNGDIQTGTQLILSAMTTVWLPGIPAERVFNYLYDGNRRWEWDSLVANGEPMQEEVRITTGQFYGNHVSIFRAIASDGTNNNNKLILQEAYTDTSCMLVVYVPVDEQSMKDASMNGGGCASFSTPPSGFAVIPDGLNQQTSPWSSSGAIVSAMYQILPSSASPQNLTLDTVNNISSLLYHAVNKIKSAVQAEVVVPA
ncbi:homeobox-leucine zipper protein ROC6-like [Brachypodium distachyon]|uniref:homeobox-leucine zipper protein ROC6-like n=1 Tax=Brachypodium distachyon TaxID=15368 RepID=UPI000D0D9C07|nr:homeobox-leucine zipper protein ROC6-like [Brachypodium distachyon]|eukprot:XP_024314342.1 homeobox-leucine zipper protein ROC6-like [Brachypodium distachyon]